MYSSRRATVRTISAKRTARARAWTGAQGCDRGHAREYSRRGGVAVQARARGWCVKAYEQPLTVIHTKTTSMVTNWKDDLRAMYELLWKRKQ